MKDRLDEQAIVDLASVLSSVVEDIDSADFIEQANKGIVGLELKQRVSFLIVLLAEFLPNEFEKAALCLLKIAVTDERKEQWGDFTAWPLVDYASIYGLEHPKLSLKVLKHLTPLFSAEFAIRPFIEQHEAVTYTTLLDWAEDGDEHVRRLASEGARPRLPWGKQLKNWIENPDVIFPILESLKDDPSLYVRRSVANNLNDISKDHPEKVMTRCEQWLGDASKERQWVIKHSLRTLVKAGHPRVFPLLGYDENPKVTTSKLHLSHKKIILGESLALSFDLTSTATKTQTLVIDFSVTFIKSRGHKTEKVFKWKNVTLSTNETMTLTKNHPFKFITTRQYYAGEHQVTLLINGEAQQKSYFDLVIK